VAVEGEGGLRIDFCESCRAYLKTYDGQGNEALLLADWTSLHLDLVAADRGLERRAASLYGFAPPAAQSQPADAVV
jgi:FdhE protein